MELWIRSQDRENLIRIEKLCYFNTCSEMENTGKNYILNKSWIGDKDCIILGEYKTKERALEVLDEIQKVIMPKYIISNFPDDKVKNLNQTFKYNYDYIQSNGNINIRELGNYVYEMPKE